MIEVFKTNVEDCERATQILDAIHMSFDGYHANFDLQDCDNILRIECKNGCVESNDIIYLLRENNYHAEILEDFIPIKLFVISHASNNSQLQTTFQ